MPRENGINSILVIGAGPIIIGQACEFDYSGAQACKALREEGIKTILVNSNPATIMTDPDMADKIYIEPIHWRNIEKIIAIEKPDAILPTMGGQTALNTTLDLNRHKILEKYNVKIIGASVDSIDMAEDRELFKKAMEDIGLLTPRAQVAKDFDRALIIQKDIGYPIIIRPSFTLGGSGGGIAYNKQDFEKIVKRGLDLSPTNEVLLEESVIGWKEFEMEVVRDKNDNCIIVCSIENFDAMGVHTGDSITVAPAQTLTDKEYQNLRNQSIQVLRKIGVDAGGSNVLKYGMAREQVMGIEVVLPDGSIFTDLKSLRKNNTGYDLKQLFIGAEGTLGVITKVSLRLSSSPKREISSMVSLKSVDDAINLLKETKKRFGDSDTDSDSSYDEYYEPGDYAQTTDVTAQEVFKEKTAEDFIEEQRAKFLGTHLSSKMFLFGNIFFISIFWIFESI